MAEEVRKPIIVTAAIIGSRPQWLNMYETVYPLEKARFREIREEYKDFLNVGWRLELHNEKGEQPTGDDEVCSGLIYFPPGADKSNPLSYFTPVAPAQIIASAKACHRAGASIVHFHTREAVADGDMLIPEKNDGQWGKIQKLQYLNTIDPVQYGEIVAQIKDQCPELILNFSTSARAMGFDVKKEESYRTAHLRAENTGLVPQIASCSLCDVWFADSGYANTPEFVKNQLEFFRQNKIRPEIELFGTNFVDAAINEWKNQILACGKPPMFTLVLGTNMRDDVPVLPTNVQGLKPIVERLRGEFGKDCVISILGAGKMQGKLATLASELDLDGVRVGMEDSLKVPTDAGIQYATGPDQVEWVVQKIKDAGMTVATPEEAMQRLGLQNMAQRGVAGS